MQGNCFGGPQRRARRGFPCQGEHNEKGLFRLVTEGSQGVPANWDRPLSHHENSAWIQDQGEHCYSCFWSLYWMGPNVHFNKFSMIFCSVLIILIMLLMNSCFICQGFTKEFPCLTSLITHHSVMPELLPCPLSLARYNPSFTTTDSSKDFAEIDADPDYNTLSDFRKILADCEV